MNGEMNGTMEDTQRTSSPSPSANLVPVKSTLDSIEPNVTDCSTSNGTEDFPNLKSNEGKIAVENSKPDVIENQTVEDPDKADLISNFVSGAMSPALTLDDREYCAPDLHEHKEKSNPEPSHEDKNSPDNSKDESSEPELIKNKNKDCPKPNRVSNVTISDMKFLQELAKTRDLDKELYFSEDDDTSSDEDSEEFENNAETVNLASDVDDYDDGNDIIVVEDITPKKHNGNNHNSGSPEVHEIVSEEDNDDCVVTEDNISKSATSNTDSHQKQPNKSKRKRFVRLDLDNGDESDVEVIPSEDDPLNLPPEKQTLDRKSNKPPMVKIHHLTTKRPAQTPKTTSTYTKNSIDSGSLYESIATRGTTLTAVKVHSSSGTQSVTPAPVAAPIIPSTPLLPSLTDDMVVLEAPSFVVPYVYEKPPLMPVRELIDMLDKEIAKEEQERLEKEKLENEERREKEKQERKERRERGEHVQSDEEKTENDEGKKKETGEKKERRRRKKRSDDDDVSWDGESSSESDEDDDDKVEALKETDPDIEEIITDLSTYKSSGKTDNYFECSLGKFFMNIGLNLVTEHVQNDLLKQQTKRLHREKKAGRSTIATTSSIASLEKNIELSKTNNADYAFKQVKCEFCSFRTESTLVMSHHLETPHMKNNFYNCNFCSFAIRTANDILWHTEKVHAVRARLERALSNHQCVNCPYEDNGKGKMARHVVSCTKRFKPDLNLSPPVDWEPPAKIPKLTKQRNTMSGIAAAFSRQMDGKAFRPPGPKTNMLANLSFLRGNNIRPMQFGPRSAAMPMGPRPVPRNTFNTPFTVPTMNNTPKVDPKSTQQPSMSIGLSGSLIHPAGSEKSTFVICEICDGYIKDLEQLRNHMQWIHKVKIHTKMIYNRPPLNCQKCQFRFFTDKGLERHLLGSHGLVTSCMQEAANKGKDAGRCPVCGRVYQYKLLYHVAKDHNLTLKPAHLSYKCTVCAATFGMYKQFESHVYSAHRVVAKRVTDAKCKPPADKTTDTITIQSTSEPTTSATK